MQNTTVEDDIGGHSELYSADCAEHERKVNLKHSANAFVVKFAVNKVRKHDVTDLLPGHCARDTMRLRGLTIYQAAVSEVLLPAGWLAVAVNRFQPRALLVNSHTWRRFSKTEAFNERLLSISNPAPGHANIALLHNFVLKSDNERKYRFRLLVLFRGKEVVGGITGGLNSSLTKYCDYSLLANLNSLAHFSSSRLIKHTAIRH